MRRVDDFFDRHAAAYHGQRAGMQRFHAVIADILAHELAGEVLSIGGLWQDAEVSPPGASLTVADLSEQMLRQRAQARTRIRADARALPFRSRTFDHVVLPLVLHHITGSSGGGGRAQEAAGEAIREARRVIRPGGKLWISELCVPRWVYAAELLVAPLTRRALAAIQTPLVVMHSRAYYDRAMRDAGFADVRVHVVRPEGARGTDWITPIIGVKAFKVPRALYPVVPTLISGVVPA